MKSWELREDGLLVDSYKILERIIQRGRSKVVAQFMHVSEDLVRRWRREPVSDEELLATGMRNPIDRVEDLIKICFLDNPRETALIVEHINGFYQDLVSLHTSRGFDDRRSQAEASVELLKQATEAINSWRLNGVQSDETWRELVLLREATTEILARARVERSGDRSDRPVENGQNNVLRGIGR